MTNAKTVRAAPHWRRTDALLLTLAVIAALAMRLFFWLDQGRAGVIFSGDADEYYRGAVHLYLDGSYYDDGQWLRPPLTSLFWAACFHLFGPHMPGTLLAQAALSSLVVLLVGDSARRLFASRRAGILAALLTALFLPYASIASQALSETVFVLTLALTMWLLVLLQQGGMRPVWLALLAGAAFGSAALARPVGLYALPFLLLWVLWLARRPAPNRAPGRWLHVLAPGLLSATALLAGFVLVVAPWSIRNYVVYEQLVLVDTNGGVSFWFGTINDPSEQKMQDVWKATLPNSALREDAALALAWQNIRADPWRYLARTRLKAASLWQFETRLFAGNAATGITVEEGRLFYALLADAQYLLVVLLALAAIALTRRTERSWALIGWPLYGTLLSALSLGHPRLRLPLLLPLLLYAALTLARPRELWARWRAAAPWRRALVPALWLAFALLVYASVYRSFFHSQLWLLAAELGGGSHARERAVAADPDGYLPWLAIGASALADGMPALALEAYGRASALAPRNVEAQARQIPLLLAHGEQAAAEARLMAIRKVDWDNNLLYQWAWRELGIAPRPRLDMDGARDVGQVEGFYRHQSEGGTSYRWAMERARMRLALGERAAAPHTLRLRMRADQNGTPVDIFASDTQGMLQQISRLEIGVEWAEYRLPLPANSPSALEITLRARAPLRDTQQPYPRSVAIDWVEVLGE
jgi:4-amino-4-deoxy-L-arabinose transferase-like glycosyltransferase